jgi:hypothetical protein
VTKSACEATLNQFSARRIVYSCITACEPKKAAVHMINGVTSQEVDVKNAVEPATIAYLNLLL